MNQVANPISFRVIRGIRINKAREVSIEVFKYALDLPGGGGSTPSSLPHSAVECRTFEPIIRVQLRQKFDSVDERF